MSRVVGSIPGTAGYGGDGLSATSSSTQLDHPSAAAFDAQGDLYIADTRNNLVREVTASTGKISTFAGSPPPAASGYTGDAGLATLATLNAPSGLAVDPAGNVYIADTQNNAIRKVSAATGDISTIAENGVGEYYYTQAVAPFKSLFAAVAISKPNGLALDSSANLYFADTLNLMVREIQSNYTALDLTKTPVRIGTTSATYSQTVEDDGNMPLTPLTLPGIVPDPNGAGYNGDVNAELAPPGVGICPADSNPFLAATDDHCVIGAIFAPSLSLASTFGVGVSSEPVNANIVVGTAGDTENSPLDIEMVGVATPLNSTSVTLTASPNPSYYTQSVTFKATVSTGTGSLTGTVSFYDGGVQIGTSVTVSGDVANLPISTLSVGSHTITAIYNGDKTHYNSTVGPSSTVTQVVNEFTTTTLLASVPTPSPLGASVTFTAAVTDTYNGGVPLDNTVTFTDNGAPLCSNLPLVLNAGVYTAACPAPALAQGDNPIIATYNGDLPNYILGSTSATLTQDVQGVTNLQLTALPASPTTYGQPVTFTVTIPSIGPNPATGTVKLWDGATQIGTIPLAGNPASGLIPIANLPVSTVALPDNITATYTDDVNYSSAASSLIPFVVSQAPTTTTITASAGMIALNGSVELTAVVTPSQSVTLPITGNITFTDTVGGATAPLACAPQPTVAAPTCTLPTLPGGVNSIVASYAGDADDAPSASLTPAVVTVVRESISLTSNLSPSYYGNPVVFTINIPTIGVVSATGTVTILDGTTQIGSVTLTSADAGTVTFTTTAPLPVGTDSITASYLGDANYPAIVSSAYPQVVNTATTATAVAAVPPTGIAGGTEALTATVTVTQGVSTPTGMVNFTDNGVGIGAAALSGGKATINPALNAGTNNIVATYVGDADDAGSSGPLALTVNQAATTVSVTASANPSVVLAPVTFAATVSSVGGGVPTGTVTFTATPAGGGTAITLCSQAALQPGTREAVALCATSTTALAVGTYTINAVYNGDTNDTASTGTYSSMVVEDIPTITGLDSSTTPPPNPELILVAAVVNYAPSASDATSLPVPTGSVTFTLNSAAGTLVGASTLDSTGVATLIPASLPPGNFNIVANYSGDQDHAPSSSVVANLTNPASGFTMTVTPPAVTVAAAGNVTVNVNLASISGYADSIGLGCAALPPGVNCHFTIPSSAACTAASATQSCVTLSATSTTTNPVVVSLTIDTNNPLGGGASAMNTRPGGKGFALAGLFLPLSVLFGCLFWRFRKRHAGLLTVALVLLLGGAALAVSGCASGFTESSATPGTYTIEVTGTGISSNITHYQTVTLTITK